MPVQKIMFTGGMTSIRLRIDSQLILFENTNNHDILHLCIISINLQSYCKYPNYVQFDFWLDVY